MIDTDQCIICLEPLPSLSALVCTHPEAAAEHPLLDLNTAASLDTEDADALLHVASLDGCNHILHDMCIRAWAQKTNTCPICRTPFQVVNAFHGLDGTAIASYAVEERKQVAEFDVREWLDQNVDVLEETDSSPCPICGLADREECLLLCDACDAPYHTYCMGLDHVPDGHWYCLECQDTCGPEQPLDGTENLESHTSAHRIPTVAAVVNRRRVNRQTRLFPRTRGRMRRARQQVRSIEWQGPWAEVAGRVYDGLNIDLDNPEDDESLQSFRQSQQQTERERREYQRWQQRLNIASRLGAREAFSRTIPREISEHLHTPPAQEVRTVQDELELKSDRLAWRALEIAHNGDTISPSSPGRRKRRARSETASLGEVAPEPERKLKRPCTRRLPITHREASPKEESVSSRAIDGALSPTPQQLSHLSTGESPTFLSSLLREMEMSPSSDDENLKSHLSNKPVSDAYSPASSPSPSSQNSPRIFSTTPSPHPGRTGSPPLLLSSHIEPQYGPANYSPKRSNSNGESDPDDQPDRRDTTYPTIQQPRPRRPGTHRSARSQDSSPNRSLLSTETKLNINKIVRSALSPHWHAKDLSSEQYSEINRAVSRKLYDDARNTPSIDEAKGSWEKKAAEEVAHAVVAFKARLSGPSGSLSDAAD